MTQNVNLSREITYAEAEPRENEKHNKGQSPLQIEQKSDATHKADSVTDDVNNGARKEPAEPIHV
jgi:hypothetical protein